MSPIDDHHAALGGDGGLLGAPTGPELSTPDGIGRFRHYLRGSVYWSPVTRAHEVHGAIAAAWSGMGWERSPLGYPLTDELGTPDGVGRFNLFQNGAIYWTPGTGAFEVRGAIHVLWAQLGSERSALGYPLSNEETTPDRHSQHTRFQGGDIWWDAHRGAYEVLTRPAFPRPDPAVGGAWAVAPFTADISGLHAALLPTGARGSIWFLSYLDETGHGHHDPQPAHDGESRVLDLATRTASTPGYEGPHHHLPNLFCGGHAFLPDGRLLMVGGDREDQDRLRMLHTFTPGGAGGGRWRDVDRMAQGRWYGSAVTLPDGRVLIVAGERRVFHPAQGPNPNLSYEIFDPDTDEVGPATPAPQFGQFAGSVTYPWVFVLPGDRVLVHGGTRTVFLDLGTLAFDPTPVDAIERPDRNSRTYGVEGTSVLLPLLPDASPPYRATVLALGGGGAPPVGMRTPATASCEVLDLGVPTPAWAPAATMHAARVMPDAVLLPDRTVLVMSGSSRGYADNGANPVWESELYDPATDTWTPMDHTVVPRLYHATALLLPDATVMTSGTDATWNPEVIPVSELRLEIFRPPYLFRGDRPTITSAPDAADHGSVITVGTPDAASITTVALMRNGSCTHSFNPDQRHVGLEITSRSADELTLRMPPDGAVAPPGWYMLFLLRDGVRSEAEFVRLF
ncbi:galactose oxidase-like domain-containing protein [Actinomycetospora sp. CA-053990]|uniref:galactose oxidase-like domain-containing protein n=1 Tax=Actinomycetospora sp. CA-053990 TaxID=3239891 RepID=UPI003D90D051